MNSKNPLFMQERENPLFGADGQVSSSAEMPGTHLPKDNPKKTPHPHGCGVMKFF
jgi:hypothetical protein